MEVVKTFLNEHGILHAKMTGKRYCRNLVCGILRCHENSTVCCNLWSYALSICSLDCFKRIGNITLRIIVLNSFDLINTEISS